MKTARNISWEIRGRRLVEGTLVDQHVATGFGPDAASAIRWARRHSPVNTSAFPDADLRVIPDPLGHDFGVKQSPFAFPTVSCLLAVLVVFAGNFEANGGDSISAGFSADGQATRAGAGMVAAPTRTGFESLLHKTAGPADSLLSGHRKAPVARTETRQSGFIPNSASDTLRGDSAQVGNDATTTSRVSVRPAQKFYPSPSPSRDDASRLAFVESHAGGRETVRWQRNPDVWAGVAGDAGGRIGRPHFLSPSPEVFHDRVGLSADLPSVGSTRGVGNFFDRDTKAALLTLAVAAVVLVRSGFCLDRNDREESARRVREMEGRL